MINKAELEIGQILWLKVKYQIDIISEIKHPMLIAKIEEDYIEVIALDKTAGKLHQLYHRYNYYIDSDNPKESVIFEDSYAQLNTKLTIDKIEELKSARKTLNKLSNDKLNTILEEYQNYQNKYGVEEQRIVHMTNNEILYLNPELQRELVTE